jgi:hypothetical protein
MATIEVFPLSVNGISPPLNLLSQAFTNKLDPKNLFYPLDLAANPNYGHAIQISPFRTSYNVSNIGKGIIDGSEALNLSSFSKILNPTNWKALNPTETTEGTISLYMPDSLQMNYSHDWSQISLTQTLGLASYVGSAVADWQSIGGKSGSAADKGAVANLYAKGLGIGAAGLINPDLGVIAGNLLDQVPNPQLQMLYKGTELREFQFQFKFTPASKKEAVEVEAIIESLQYFSAPKLLGSAAHQYLEPPHLFKIDFLFVGGTGLQSAVTNFFRNIGTNILTSQLYADMFAGTQQANLNPKNNKARIFQIYNPCALQNISVDYAPNGWAAYEDGAPVETTVSLTFKEVDIVTKDTIRPKNGTGFLGLPGFDQIASEWIGRNTPTIIK